MKAKIVFITGASSGIGEGCARKFAKEGWNLILNARTVSKLEELKAELEKEYGIQVYVLPFDVATGTGCRRTRSVAGRMEID